MVQLTVIFTKKENFQVSIENNVRLHLLFLRHLAIDQEDRGSMEKKQAQKTNRSCVFHSNWTVFSTDPYDDTFVIT